MAPLWHFPMAVGISRMNLAPGCYKTRQLVPAKGRPLGPDPPCLSPPTPPASPAPVQMDSTDNFPLPENPQLLTGPPLVSIVLNWWLYGILGMQYLYYCMHSKNDKLGLKVVVHTLFLLDTIQTIMTMHDAFYWFVHHFGDYYRLYDLNLAGFDAPFLDGVIAILAQWTYCWRIWRLSKWRVLPIVTAFIALLASVSGMVLGGHVMSVGNITKLNPVYRIPIMLWLFASAITDVIIASAMTYLLLKLNRGRFRETTGAAVMRILTLTLETNALTAAVAIQVVVVFNITSIAPPNTNVYITGGYLLGKLYSNSFMVLLNQRLQRRSEGNHESSSHSSTNVSRYRPRRHSITGDISMVNFNDARARPTPPSLDPNKKIAYTVERSVIYEA